jgi:hypothetical protein
MTRKENLLRSVRFEEPEYIPMSFHINASCWNHYETEFLLEMQESHPLLFPNFQRESVKLPPAYGLCARRDKPYLDPWGCLWETSEDGITGSVHVHPLEDWENFENYLPPNPEFFNGIAPVDWEKIKNSLKTTREAGELTGGGLPHGHTFLRLCDIRGYENLIFDMIDERPELVKLMQINEEFNLKIIKRFIKAGAEMMSYPEDLGMQHGPMLSPEQFRKYIKPSYQRLMRPAREAGCIIHMHSDGDIRTLLDDLIDGGVEVINLQDLVNGIDWIKENLAGKVCIDLDIDRQSITRFGSPAEIEALIREEVQKLGSRAGGLWMIYGLYPGVPEKNVEALMDAMEKYSTYYN